ncbi:MAG: uroporphyrinogen decarboxylase family protein [Spirochaetota bacterium]
MAERMTPRERMRAAMNRQEPDRVPMVLWGSYYTLNDQTYFNLLEHLGLGEPLPPFRRHKPRNSNYYDDRVLDLLGTDARYVWSGFTDLGGARMDADGKDAWGVVWRRMGDTVVSCGAPLAAMDTEGIETYPWPDPERYLDFDLMRARVRQLERDYPDHAVGARAVNSYGPFEQAAELRGREQFYLDMAMAPELAGLIVRKCTEVICRTQELYLDAVGGRIDFFEIPGDDYGSAQGLMISPRSFREMFKPELARIAGMVKRYRADLPVVFHTDGAVAEIIPDLVDAGVDVLNPLEPLPATDWEAVKRAYGDRLAFMGGIDLKQALTGPVEGVREEVARRIRIFGPGGGYILTSANHMPPDVPPENIVAMFQACRQLGEYPLR